MGIPKSLNRTVIIGLSLFLLSGCGSTAANDIEEAVKNEEFSTAKQIYQDAVNESDAPVELNDEVSENLQDYLYEVYQETDTSEEPAFYYLLTSIEEIGIDDYDLDEKIQNYKEMYEGSDSYAEDDVDEEYTEGDKYYEDDYPELDKYYEEEDTSSEEYSSTDIDKDCPDFDTPEDAQAFFEANGGPEEDPHDLDRDGDGLACEWN